MGALDEGSKPLSDITGRYAVRSGQSTWVDHRRPRVRPGLGPPKAHVGQLRSLTNDGFRAGRLELLLIRAVYAFMTYPTRVFERDAA